MNALSRLLSPELLIPIFSILMPLGIVVVALVFAQRFQERKHKTIVDLLEKGLPVPRELLGQSRREGSPLMRALTLVGVGVGLCGFFSAMFGTERGLWAIGLIPLAIGIAQLVAIRLEPPRRDEQPSPIDLR